MHLLHEQKHIDCKEFEYLQVLKLIEQRPTLSQRALVEGLGSCLGEAHYILKALVEKGQMKTENFRRRDGKLAYAHILTPQGLAEEFFGSLSDSQGSRAQVVYGGKRHFAAESAYLRTSRCRV